MIGRGRPDGIPPKRVPIVSTSKPVTTTTAVPPSERDDGAGHRGHAPAQHQDDERAR